MSLAMSAIGPALHRQAPHDLGDAAPAEVLAGLANFRRGKHALEFVRHERFTSRQFEQRAQLVTKLLDFIADRFALAILPTGEAWCFVALA
ncbi:hypothetical protein D3C72_2271510 [compost metagenome]